MFGNLIPSLFGYYPEAPAKEQPDDHAEIQRGLVNISDHIREKFSDEFDKFYNGKGYLRHWVDDDGEIQVECIPYEDILVQPHNIEE